VAQGFLPVAAIRPGLEAEIEILGDKRRATLVEGPLWDADGARMRG
jgi:dimethylglycine dehydrogenase